MRSNLLRWNSSAQTFSSADDTRSATLIVYFGPNAVIESDAFQSALKAACPVADIVGCTTGTLIDGDMIHDGAAAAIAMSFDATSVAVRAHDISPETSRDVGRKLGQDLDAPGLAGVIVFCDSLNVEGAELVEGLRDVLPKGLPISGGLASDGSDFQRTLVGANGAPKQKQAAVVALYGDRIRIGQGCAHGWDEFGPPREITKAQGLELLELDGRPALDLYEHYLGQEAAELPQSALRYPLLVWNPANPEQQVVRTVLNIDRERRSLIFASTIHSGWRARLMRGAFDHLAEGAGVAATEALAPADRERGGVAFLISCVGRRILMGQRTDDEVETAQSVLGPMFQQFGFYSHGEISAKVEKGFTGLHNQTMTVFTLQEAA